MIHSDTRRQTKSRLKTFFSSLQRSSGNPRVAVLGEMLQKNLNVSDIFCGSFSLFFVLHFFAISSICMHSQHSQTKLSHHHTELIQSYHIQTIIPKSYRNQSILETYVYMCCLLLKKKSAEMRSACVGFLPANEPKKKAWRPR